MNSQIHSSSAGLSLPGILGLQSDQALEMMFSIVSCGCMGSSAVASPILFEFRGIWLADIAVFFVAVTAFMLQHLDDIKTYGPVTLVFVTILGLTASSASKDLKELIPWMPPALALLLLLTVFFLPKIRQAPNQLNDFLYAMEEGRSRRYRILPTEEGSVRTEGHFRSRNESLEMDRQLLDLNVSQMDHRPPSRFTERSSFYGSEIDLNEHIPHTQIAIGRMVGHSRAGYLHTGLSEASSDTRHSQAYAATGHIHPFHVAMEDSPRSPPPESMVVNSPSSASAGSGRPL